jgi:serine/threonine-protein kinase
LRSLIVPSIKPANVFLCRRWGEPDAVKVLDFGLAKNNAGPPSSVTGQDVVLGTPFYISPEALKSAALVDARSDIYSLGAVAYYMLTGEPVFTDSSAARTMAGAEPSRSIPARVRPRCALRPPCPSPRGASKPAPFFWIEPQGLRSTCL